MLLVESPLRLLTAAAPLNHEGENAWKEKRVPPSIMELFGGKLSTLVGWIDDVKKSQIVTYLILQLVIFINYQYFSDF